MTYENRKKRTDEDDCASIMTRNFRQVATFIHPGKNFRCWAPQVLAHQQWKVSTASGSERSFLSPPSDKGSLATARGTDSQWEENNHAQQTTLPFCSSHHRRPVHFESARVETGSTAAAKAGDETARRANSDAGSGDRCPHHDATRPGGRHGDRQKRRARRRPGGERFRVDCRRQEASHHLLQTGKTARAEAAGTRRGKRSEARHAPAVNDHEADRAGTGRPDDRIRRRRPRIVA